MRISGDQGVMVEKPRFSAALSNAWWKSRPSGRRQAAFFLEGLEPRHFVHRREEFPAIPSSTPLRTDSLKNRETRHPDRQTTIIHTTMRLTIRLFLASLFAVLPLTLTGQSSPSTAPPTSIPTIDGAAGPCSLDLTVLTPDHKPAASATVKVHIAYRFGGFHKLDLEAGTNADGKVKFTGLPSRVRRSTLEFQATKDDLSGTIQYDPSADCHGTKQMKLEKKSATAQQ